MITTVTTTTTSTLMSTASLGLVAIGTLLILLVKKEIALASEQEWSSRVSQAVNVAIVPLLLVFGMTVVTRLAGALG